MPRTPSQPNSAPRFNLWLTLLLVAFAIYAAVFIGETSFMVDGSRYFVLQDDGMISMRFARNLARGYGLVWNPHGAHIEGFTNLLWVLVISVFHLLPVAASKMSLLVQVFSALLVAATSVCVYSLTNRLAAPALSSESLGGAGTVRPRRVGLVAAAFTLFYYPFVNWSLQGSEVSGMALVATAGALLAAHILETSKRPAWLYLLLCAGLLLRADGFVLYAAVLAYMIAADSKNRLSHIGIGLSCLILVMGALTAFRLSYFGAPLPNTYYLKMTGYPTLPRIMSGLYKLGVFVGRSRLVPVATAFAAIPLLRDRRIGLLATVIAVQAAYSVYVGGDAWEWYGGANRYLCVVMPLGFVLLALAARYWYRAVSPRTFLLAAAGWKAEQGRRVIATAVVAAFVGLNAAAMDWREPLLLSPPPEISSNQGNVEYAFLVRQLTTPSAKVAVTWAGTTPYFCDREYIDLLGKCDSHIAHERMHVPKGKAAYTDFYPGHLKWDYAYSIGRLKPDLILRLDNLHPDDAPFMDPYGVLPLPDRGMYVALRTGSPRIVSGNTTL